MTLIDTHSHIYLPEFEPDRKLMLERAEKEGVKQIVMPAIDCSTHDAMLRVERENPGVCYSMMGLHPCSVKGNYATELKVTREYMEKKSFKAVGEIGLDFYWDKTYTEQQYATFHEQIEWALHYNLPVVIHSRNSTDECINVVKDHQNGSLKGVFHCFSGNSDQANQIISLGFYLGIGGVLTYKKSGLDTIMEKINLDYLVLETDAPYLAPVPFRGKRNESGYIKYIAQKLAEIKNNTLEEIALVTTKNAINLFGEF